jgi:hypothetical protein
MHTVDISQWGMSIKAVPTNVRNFEAIVVVILLAFGLAIEESLRWPSSYAKLRTSLYTTTFNYLEVHKRRVVDSDQRIGPHARLLN